MSLYVACYTCSLRPRSPYNEPLTSIVPCKVAQSWLEHIPEKMRTYQKSNQALDIKYIQIQCEQVLTRNIYLHVRQTKCQKQTCVENCSQVPIKNPNASSLSISCNSKQGLRFAPQTSRYSVGIHGGFVPRNSKR